MDKAGQRCGSAAPEAEPAPLRVLIVSRYFPPANSSGAIRLGKMAKYLLARGHDVRVVAPDVQAEDSSLPLEIAPERVLRVRWLDLDRLFDPRGWRRSSIVSSEPPAGAAGETRGPSSAWRTLSNFYRHLVLYPDRSAGWCLHLLPALRRLLRDWRPDVILVSGPPFSTFAAVALAAHRARVPWLAEFRDRWADDLYTPDQPGWRRRLDQRVERWLVRRAAGIVTVSQPWAEVFEQSYGGPVATVMNGFDPADLPSVAGDPAPGLPLRIVHLGTIYALRRDPTPLFQAIGRGGFAPDELRIVFHGQGLGWVRQRSTACGVEAFVELREQVPRPEALRLQAEADVLLLLQWNDPSEVGNVPAKLFEYLAARRPVLGLGPVAGVPARLLKERQAGLVSNDLDELARCLRGWVERKRTQGRIPPLPASVTTGLTRDEQYAILEAFLVRLARGARQPA